MNEKRKPLDLNADDGNWSDYADEFFPDQTLNDIVKMNLRMSPVQLKNNKKEFLTKNMLGWLKTAERNNRDPQSYYTKISLKNEGKTNIKRGSHRTFVKTSLSIDEISSILYDAFGSDKNTKSRPYGSGGALFPINVFLILLNDDCVDGLIRGAYYYNPMSYSLYCLKQFKDVPNNVIQQALFPVQKPNSGIAFAYAADLRKVVKKYNYLGYKNALIEVGLMAQSLKNALSNNLGEYSCQDFNSMMLTKLIGLDTKNAPVQMIQWVGKIIDD
ncbi:SagB/ThcOx family dehydrogenase [Lactobacillus sp. ESL0684]|uniref:SagB/ThcOx family dehydrogenase n=1 Tax=Lactobacillus sp. ESL0684 TaxID=2983213 RepID=UPI0023F9D1B8|nr:SagB/ThcOx family dehydrogenase [Lactobacillus sp. ESL0684]WEV43865.1 SagB/ThcOx family dehydrogenase [Lactobacillus sp. ESL0684]